MKTCISCGLGKPLEEFWRKASAFDGKSNYCRKCDSARSALYQQQNPGKVAALKARWQKNNLDKVAEANNRWALKNRKAWKLKNRKKINAQNMALRTVDAQARAKQAKVVSQWQKKNPQKCAAHTMARHAAKLRAMPVWANYEAIADIYAEAARLRRVTGERYEVDHSVPLQGKTVSGLHWEGNLQILLKAENISKHNRHWPDMP